MVAGAFDEFGVDVGSFEPETGFFSSLGLKFPWGKRLEVGLVPVRFPPVPFFLRIISLGVRTF